MQSAFRRPSEGTFRGFVRAEDIDAVRRLVAATGFFRSEEIAVAAELVEETLVKGEAAGYHFLFADRSEDTAEETNALDGYACFGHNTMTVSSWDLYWIAVAPQSQGRGLGRALLAVAEEQAAARGCEQMWVDTSGREQYRPTRDFYLSCGYRVAAQLEDFYAPGDDKVVLVRRLPGAAGSRIRA
jgi:ribosomal protein S18 acetylase RimI-like enzyme